MQLAFHSLLEDQITCIWLGLGRRRWLDIRKAKALRSDAGEKAGQILFLLIAERIAVEMLDGKGLGGHKENANSKQISINVPLIAFFLLQRFDKFGRTL